MTYAEYFNYTFISRVDICSKEEALQERVGSDATEDSQKASTLQFSPPNSTFVLFCSNLLTSPLATNTGNECSGVYFQAVILTGSRYFTP